MKKTPLIRMISDKKDIKIIFGNGVQTLSDVIFRQCGSVAGNQYDLTCESIFPAKEILRAADQDCGDIFILILNNIRYAGLYPVQTDAGNWLKFIMAIKEKCNRPVIAFSGWLPHESFADDIREIAEYYFPLPFNPDEFKSAFRKCLDMLPGS